MKTIKSIQKSCRACLFAAAVIVALSPSAYSQTVVTNADITNSGTTYNYAVTGATLEANIGDNNFGTVVSNSNVYYIDDGGTSMMYAAANGETSASMVLGWNFAGSSFTPTSVDLTNMFLSFDDGSAPKVTYTLSTSTDDVNFTPYYTNSVFSATDNQTLALSSPSAFYLEVSFSSPTSFSFEGDEWARGSASDSTDAVFSADFTGTSVSDVPEPSTYVLLGLGLALLLFRQRRAA